MSREIKAVIEYGHFAKVDIRAGTIVSARLNVTAQKPAYVLEIYFGPELGSRSSSAQICEGYSASELLGLQIVAITNFPRKKVADVWSEVLILGIVQPGKPTILLSPLTPVENGASVL